MFKKPYSAGTLVMLIVGSWTTYSHALTAQIFPSQDNSIYSEGDASNAQGSLFAGQTAGGSLRRALMEFNVAGSIPSGSTITSASLTLTQIKIGPGSAATFELHPLNAGWGEGTSIGSGGGGSATVGDATWNFRLYSTDTWATAGGDFGATSASALLGGNGAYTFSSAGLATDVQSWLNTPSSNFGWILLAGNEGAGTSAREFGSRETGGTLRPTLNVSYTTAAIPEPGSLLLLGSAGVAMMISRRTRK